VREHHQGDGEALYHTAGPEYGPQQAGGGAGPSSLREGRTLQITKDGEMLLYYANIVTDAIDRAADYFRLEEYSNLIKLYRIGGTSIPLLTEGCYNLRDYRINTILVRNSDLPKIVGSGIADIVIADDRYMNLATHQYVERIPLYQQQLILTVEKSDPLARRDEIAVKDLGEIPLIGRTSPVGFNDWLNEIR